MCTDVHSTVLQWMASNAMQHEMLDWGAILVHLSFHTLVLHSETATEEEVKAHWKQEGAQVNMTGKHKGKL
eukprot:642118-Rhodomonas_salina.8